MIPKYDELYFPVLHAMSGGNVFTNKELIDLIAASLKITSEERQEATLAGTPVFANRVQWALVYLRKAGLVETVSRGHHHLTLEGKRVIQAKPDRLDNTFLSRYPSFRDFYKRKQPTQDSSAKNRADEDKDTPDDMIDRALASLNEKLSEDLMAEIMSKDATFFEKLVVKLLLKMGYGGSLSDSGIVTQRSNDGGIDGIIREDKLGFDQIYIQAKRWDPDKSIQRPEIQRFYGALAGFGASKGLFITTADFSDGAKQYAEQQHIVLVNGIRLTNLMIEYNVGVSPIATYQIKSVDTDFFSEES